MTKYIIVAVLVAGGVAAGSLGAVLKNSGDTADCKRQERSVIVNLDDHKHRHILDHVWDAIQGNEKQSVPRSRDGQPERALLHIDRSKAKEHRAQSLKGIPTRPDEDRDEYPPAMSREGGKGADVRYVDDSENQSAGSRMSQELKLYCDGQPFRFEERPK